MREGENEIEIEGDGDDDGGRLSEAGERFGFAKVYCSHAMVVVINDEVITAKLCC